MDALSLPRRPRGRLSAAAEAQYQERRRAFCAAILKYVDDGEAVDDFEAATEAMQSEMQAEVAKLLLQHIGGAS